MAALLQHQPGGLDAQVLDRFSWRLARLGAECTAKLARTEMRRIGETGWAGLRIGAPHEPAEEPFLAGTAILTLPIFRLPLLVLATSLVLAGQSSAADTRATDIHLATADPVSDSQARVERPAPTVPVVIALGDRTSVLTYWVDEPDGFHVITTVDTVSRGRVDREDHHAIVRFSTTIQPGEMQTISVPGPYGSPSHTMHIRRLGDQIEVLASRGRASR